MANLVEPRGTGLGAAVPDDAVPGGPSGHEGELTALVRRWVQAGRHDQLLRLAPAREELDDLTPDLTPDITPDLVPEPAPDPPATFTAPPVELPAVPPAPPEPRLRVPALPHRPTADEAEHATRLAVLIDARRTSEEAAAALLGRCADRGSVNVCRAYADWTRSDLGAWVGRLRREGLHSFHQFADDDDQALVAMAIDAVDIAREASVDELVIAGDLTSMMPLVHRLHAAGVRVVLVGSALTPHDVRGACDEFLPAESLVGEQVAPVGRHRA